jgi:hypothetical protein
LLGLSGCHQLSGDLSPLAGLTSLKKLHLGRLKLSGDLSHLAGLVSLQSLRLDFFEDLSGDLSPLASLTLLQSLNLAGCEKLSGCHLQLNRRLEHLRAIFAVKS